MPRITFLSSDMPLVKTIEQAPDKSLITHPYPHALLFTSDTIDIATTYALVTELVKRQYSGQCLLKGTIKTPLIKQRRAGATTSDAATDWVCFDLDKAPFATPQEFMDSIKLGNVSYAVQFSASSGLPNAIGLSCHIFVFLSEPLLAPQLKTWLYHLNFSTKILRENLRLSRTAIALSYPLDVTCCQNDKLIYTCAPEFKGMKDPVKSRIEFVKKTHATLDVKRITLMQPEVMSKMARDVLNEKRKTAQLPVLRAGTVIVGEYEVQNKPGELGMTGGPKRERDFVYFNINGGQNWSYYHPDGNFELIHNFKSEPFLRTKEVFPDYYRECVRQQNTGQSLPSPDGTMLLAYRDRRTASYWNGTWNPGTEQLICDGARSEKQIDHFLLAHGKQPMPFIPLWDRTFDPRPGAKVIDETALPYPTMNLFSATSYMRNAETHTPTLGKCPTIARIIKHCVGDGDVLEHFYNWLAVLFQHRVKPCTAWIFHGHQGTGKDTIVARILKPLFGEQWTVERNQNELNSDFTGWVEYALIAHIREIDIDSLDNGGLVESKLKNYIVDVTVPIRKMRTDSYQANNYTGFIFSSNKPHPVKIPKDDRRFNVGRFQLKKLVVSIEELEERIPHELQAFADYLMSRSADRAVAATPIVTQERDDIMSLSMTASEHTARYLLEGNLEGMFEAMPDEKVINELHGASSIATYANAYASTMRRCLAEHLDNKTSRLTREELGMIFQYCVGNVPLAPNKLTSYLKHHGIKTERVRIGCELQYGIEIQWQASKKFLADVADQRKPTVVKHIRRAG